MLKLELRAAQNSIPGQGELRIQGWQETSAGLELAVQRNQDGYYLDASGNWSASQRWSPLADVSDAGDHLLSVVGPWLVDPLTADQRMTYMFYLRNADGSDKGVLRIVGELLSSAAAGKPAVTATPVLAPEPPPSAFQSEPLLPPEPKTEPPVKPEQPLVPPPQKTSRLPLLILLVALLLIVAGLVWWWMSRADGAAPTQAASSPCSPQILSSSQDDLALLQACVKSQPDSAQVLELIKAGQQAKRCNLVQRLYAYKAQSGDVDIALAYARQYDPEGFTPGACIDKADGETAAYWYERVLEQQPDNAHAKQRWEALQP